MQELLNQIDEVVPFATQEEIDMMLYTVVKAIGCRADVEELAENWSEDGILLEVTEENTFKICGKKRPH